MPTAETYPRYLVDWNEDGAYDHALSNVTSVLARINIAHGVDVLENTQFNIPRQMSGNLDLIGAEFSPNHTTQLTSQLNRSIPMKVELSANHDVVFRIGNASNDGRPEGSGTPLTSFTVTHEIDEIMRKPFAYYCNTATEGQDGMCSFADVIDRIGLWTGVPFSRQRSFPYPSRFNQQRFYHVGSSYELFQEFGTASPNNIFLITRDGNIACFDITGTGVGSKPSADKSMSQSSFKIYSATRKEDDSSIINSIRIGGGSVNGLIDSAFNLTAHFGRGSAAGLVTEFDKGYPGEHLYPDVISIDPDDYTSTFYRTRTDAYTWDNINDPTFNQVANAATMIRTPQPQLQRNLARSESSFDYNDITLGVIDWQIWVPRLLEQQLVNYSSQTGLGRLRLTFSDYGWVTPIGIQPEVGDGNSKQFYDNADDELGFLNSRFYAVSTVQTGRFTSFDLPIYVSAFGGFMFGLKITEFFKDNYVTYPMVNRIIRNTITSTDAFASARGRNPPTTDQPFEGPDQYSVPTSTPYTVNYAEPDADGWSSSFDRGFTGVRWRFNVRANVNIDQTDRQWFFYSEQPPVPSVAASASAFTDSVDQFGVRALQVSQLAVRDIESWDIGSRLDFDPTGDYDAQYATAFAPIAQNWADNTGYIPRPYFISELELPLWQGSASQSEALAAFEPGNYINLRVQDDIRPVDIDKHVLLFYWELTDSQTSVPRIRLRTLDTQATPVGPAIPDRALTWRGNELQWRTRYLTWR